jgi:hypothetical protein
VLALQSAALTEDVLLLCDNAAVLCDINKWVGQGGKATIATAPDADIPQEIVCLLTQRVRAGRATFLIKVKSHRGEPINERADTLAEEGREVSPTKEVGRPTTRGGTSERIARRLRCRKGTRRYAQCGRIAYATFPNLKASGVAKL